MMLFFDNIGAKLGVNGALIAIIGLIVIALLLLILIIRLISGAKGGAKDTPASAPAKHSPSAYIPETQPAAAPQTAPAVAPAIGLSTKKVAAIMAAVSMASGVPVNQLRFTAIRRTGTFTSPWSSSGTADIINTRQTYL